MKNRVLDLDRVLNLVCECGVIMELDRRDGVVWCKQQGCRHIGINYDVPDGAYIELEKHRGAK